MFQNERLVMILMRLAVTLLFLVTFLLAGIDKWIDVGRLGGAPEWFVDQFGETMLGWLPLTPQFVGIALFETLLGIGAVVSLFSGECLGTRAPILKLTLVGSLFLFLALGFGCRLSGEFGAAADLFMYFSGALLALVVIDRDDRIATREQGGG